MIIFLVKLLVFQVEDYRMKVNASVFNVLKSPNQIVKILN